MSVCFQHLVLFGPLSLKLQMVYRILWCESVMGL